MLFMRFRMMRIFSLRRPESAFLFLQFLRVTAGSSEAFLFGRQYNLRAIGLQNPDLFVAASFLHADGRAVFFHGRYKCDADSGIPACAFHDSPARLQLSLCFRRFNHVQRGTVLDASSGIESLHFRVEMRLQSFRLFNLVQVQHRCITDQLQNIVINLSHLFALSSFWPALFSENPARGCPRAGTLCT